MRSYSVLPVITQYFIGFEVLYFENDELLRTMRFLDTDRATYSGEFYLSTGNYLAEEIIEDMAKYK